MFMSHASVDFFVLSFILPCAYVSGYLLNQITNSEAVHMSRASPANRADSILSQPMVA